MLGWTQSEYKRQIRYYSDKDSGPTETNESSKVRVRGKIKT